MLARDCDVVFCGFVRVLPDGRALTDQPGTDMNFARELVTIPFERLASGCPVAIHSVLVRRDTVLDAGQFDETLPIHEDWDLWLRVARMGARFVGVPLPLAYYRLTPDSASTDMARFSQHARRLFARTCQPDPRPHHVDPRYASGQLGHHVPFASAYTTLYTAAVVVGSGRSPEQILASLSHWPDFSEHTDGVARAIVAGLALGARTPHDGLIELWDAVAPRITEICQTLGGASSDPNTAAECIAAVELLVLRAGALERPRALGDVAGVTVVLARAPRAVAQFAGCRQLYLRIVDGVTPICEVVVEDSQISEASMARLLLELWGGAALAKCSPPSTKSPSFRLLPLMGGVPSPTLVRLSCARHLPRILLALRAGDAPRSSEGAGARDPNPEAVPPGLARSGAGSARWGVAAPNAGSELRSGSPWPRRASAGADRREFYNRVFDAADPWQSASEFERFKVEKTLSVLPNIAFHSALELGCGEGHLTEQLLSRAGAVTAVDISDVALERARRRLGGERSNFQRLDVLEDPLPTGFDLLVAVDILHQAPDAAALQRSALKLRDALHLGGWLVATHAFVLADDPTVTGFDWEHSLGAKSIERVLSATPGLELRRSVLTELFRVDLYQHVAAAARPGVPERVSCTIDSPPPGEMQQQVVPGGAVTTRAQAAVESTTRVPVLMYHRVAPHGPSALARYRLHPRSFELQLRFLRRHGFSSVTSEQLLTAMRSGSPLTGRPISFTFDDGYDDFREFAWPLLKRYGFRAEVFVVTDKVGTVADWDAAFAPPARLMTWDDIAHLQNEGAVVGSHLATHRRANELPSEALNDEASRSRAMLEARLGSAVTSVAMPYGIWDDRLLAALRASGYEVGYTTQPGLVGLDMDPLTLPRFDANIDDIAAFAKMVMPSASSGATTAPS
jgi:peptidoglycan/xylan/chitin deacetylase (PgdA/CDA1 family)/SAM-dependent methyltransferase